MPRVLGDEPAVFSKRGKPNRGLPKEDGCQWYVGRVKPKVGPKRYAHELRISGVSYFLPMQPYESNDAGRVVTRQKLLLPGFIFFLANVEDFHLAKSWRRLTYVLSAKDQWQLRADLRRLAAFTKSLIFKNFEAIQPGKLVRISDVHPIKHLRGIEATVDLRDGTTVRLDIPMLGGAAVFQIDAKYLEVVKCQ